MNESILTSVKEDIGIPEEHTDFDKQITRHINSALSKLTQMGVGPLEGFKITSDAELWSEFLWDCPLLELAKEYVFIKVKLIFDPPASSVMLQALKDELKEVEFRLIVETDPSLTDEEV